MFIDAQNLYRDTRRAFYDATAPSSAGQVDPMKLAELLVSRGPSKGPSRVLGEVRIYTGQPTPNRQQKASSAHQRQHAYWEKTGVKVFARPLRYPDDWPNSKAKEKGIDVALAVDVVFNAARNFYDVGIVVSTDTDLCPALEAVCDLNRAWGKPRVELAAWRPCRKRLTVPGYSLWTHVLEQSDYTAVADPTVYVRP